MSHYDPLWTVIKALIIRNGGTVTLTHEEYDYAQTVTADSTVNDKDQFVLTIRGRDNDS